MKTIVVGQQKGGIGKSTLTAHLAVALAKRGHRVILIDADKQQTCMKWASRRKVGVVEPDIPFASLLFSKDIGPTEYMGTIKGMRDSGKFDFCLIDVGGRDNPELRASLGVADLVVAPCLPSQPDVESLGEFDELLGSLKDYGITLRAFAVINKATTGLNFSREILAANNGIEDMEHISPSGVTITDRPTIRDAWVEGKTVFDLDTQSAAKARTEFEAIIELL